MTWLRHSKQLFVFGRVIALIIHIRLNSQDTVFCTVLVTVPVFLIPVQFSFFTKPTVRLQEPLRLGKEPKLAKAVTAADRKASTDSAALDTVLIFLFPVQFSFPTKPAVWLRYSSFHLRTCLFQIIITGRNTCCYMRY